MTLVRYKFKAIWKEVQNNSDQLQATSLIQLRYLGWYLLLPYLKEKEIALIGLNVSRDRLTFLTVER